MPPSTLEVERERVRALSQRVESLSALAEGLEDERDHARDDARAARDDARANHAELRTRAHRLGELEQEIERLRAVEARLREDLAAPPAPVERPSAGNDLTAGMRERYFALLLEMASRDGAEEHVFDRLERLALGPADSAE